MDSDDFRFWCIIIAAIAMAFMTIFIACWISCRHEENMARLGYEMIPGTSNRVWLRSAAPSRREPTQERPHGREGKE